MESVTLTYIFRLKKYGKWKDGEITTVKLPSESNSIYYKKNIIEELSRFYPDASEIQVQDIRFKKS